MAEGIFSQTEGSGPGREHHIIGPEGAGPLGLAVGR